MQPELVDSPTELVYRVGYPPDPLAWPPVNYRGRGRFDDPRNRFGVMYAAAVRRGCFLETLDVFRPDRALLQRLLAMGSTGFTPQSGLIPDRYFARLLASVQLLPGHRWLDARLTAPTTAIALSRDPSIAGQLAGLGYGARFKPGDLVGSDRRFTQAIAAWAYDHGMAGIVYSCSHDPQLACWAIFDRTPIRPGGPAEPIRQTDRELIAVAELFELTISFAQSERG